MKLLPLHTLILLLVIHSVAGNHVNRARIHNKHVSSLLQASNQPVDDAEYLFFNQTLDHFVPLNNDMEYFQQRYLVNTSMWKPGGPAFLIIGGEAELRSTSASRGAVVEMAAANGAIVFSLEHRFYGESSPFDTLDSSSLPYLNTQQALADLVNFREGMLAQYNISSTAKWAIFGCSYAGALSAWFRQKFPHLVAASLSGSSPVEAVLDFYHYDQVIAASVGPDCANSIRAATVKMQELLLNNQTSQQIKQRLTCEAIEDPVAVLYVLADTVAYVVQYNVNIKQMCTNFTSSTDDTLVDTYVTFVNYLLSYLHQTCTSFDITSFTNETVDPNEMMRQWMWQSCDELGYFQTAPPQNSLRSTLITAEWHIRNVCNKLYSGATSGPKISWINSYYGGNTGLVTSNTVFTNGDLDPWKVLSVTSSLSSSVPAIVVQEEAHCANWGASSASDSDDLKSSKELVSSYITAFIEGCESDDDGDFCGGSDSGVCTFQKSGNSVTPKCACLGGYSGNSCSKAPIPWWSLLIIGIGGLVIAVVSVCVGIRITKARMYNPV